MPDFDKHNTAQSRRFRSQRIATEAARSARLTTLAHIPVTLGATTPATMPTNCVDAEPYALRVIGTDFAPRLPDGCVIIVDPGVDPQAGQFVVAELSGAVTLGILAEKDGHWSLYPQGTEYESVALEPRQIRGVVVQRAGRRRRDHRHL